MDEIEERGDEPVISYADWIEWREAENQRIFRATLAEVVALLREMCAPPTRH